MGHVTSKSYINLQKRLDKSVQGAPASDTLYKILEILFTENEAELVSVLPLRFFYASDAAKLWKKPVKEAKEILDTLADKGILLDLKKGKTQAYILAPTMAGFFEFSLMRTDGKFDRKILSGLFYQYINVEDDFMKNIFNLSPPIARVFVQEKEVHESIILDYEKASEVVKTASCITVGTCYCRHKMSHLGKACSNPQDVCLTFNGPAESLARHKIAKKISKEEAMKIIDKCIGLGLVQIGDNVQDSVAWICNCCGCCCEALLAYKKLGYNPDFRSSFLSVPDKDKCVGCGICAQRCPVDAIKIKKVNGRKVAVVDNDICIGCGVCSRFCPDKAIGMRRRTVQFVPKDSFERVALSALNAGKLQNYIFENSSLWRHDLLKRLVRFIITLPPAKRIFAMRQVQSRFLKAIARSREHTFVNKYDGKKEDYSSLD